MTTGLGLVKSSLRKIGALTKNEAPSSDEADDAMEVINDLIASWSNDSLILYARTLESFTLTASDGTYTIGTGADFNTARPLQIIKAYVRIDTIDYPLEIVSDENFAGIQFKTNEGIPEFINYDGAYPTATIKLYPEPASNYTLFLLTEKELSSLTLAGDVTLPAGWKRALIYNAAIDLCSEYGQPVTQEVVKIASDSLAAIKVASAKIKKVDTADKLAQDNNIYSGAY